MFLISINEFNAAPRVELKQQQLLETISTTTIVLLVILLHRISSIY
jgi:hypothetical protein